MSTATLLPGSDERDELATNSSEIADLYGERESPNTLLIRRLEKFRTSTTARIGQLFTLGRYSPESANLQAAVAERATVMKQGRANAVIAEPLRPLVNKTDRKLEALRNTDRGYQHVIDYYQAQIRLKTPERGNILQRLWRRLAGEGSEIREAKRKIALATEARAETSAKLAKDPREQMRREIAGADLDVRMRVVKLAPSVAPRLPELLQLLAAGNDAPLKDALKAAAVPNDDIDELMASAKLLKGEYAGLGWRALGALGTAVTFGLSKKLRGLAAGAKNTRGIELASFYAAQADERAVYEQLSVAGQVRTLNSLPVGSTLVVDGRQMVFERVQEKKNRRVVRLVQADNPRQVFLLDITDPDAPVLKRAVGKGKEAAYRAYRDSGSRLPAFAARDRVAAPDAPDDGSRDLPSTPAVSAASPDVDDPGLPDGVSPVLFVEAAVASNRAEAERQLQALIAWMNAGISADPAAAQDARQEMVTNLNQMLTEAGSPVRVQLNGTDITLRMDADAVPDRSAALITAANPLIAALGESDASVRVAAANAALPALSAFLAAAADDAEAAAAVTRVNELIVQAYGTPVSVEVTLTGRDARLLFVATPAPEPSPALDAAATAREAMAEALDEQIEALRQLSAEHRRDEYRSSSDWWNANRGRYVGFRARALQLLADEAARSDDAFRQVFELLAQRVEGTIEPSGDFPGGHDSIDSLISDIANVTRSIRPAAAVS